MSTDQPGADAPQARTGAHPVLVYSLLRFVVLLGTGAVLYLLGLRGVWLLLFAFLLSGIASIFILDRRREAAAGGVVTAVQKVNQRIESSASAEDALVAGAAASTAGTAATDATTASDEAAEPQAASTVDRDAERAAADRAARNAIPDDDDLDHLEPDDR